MRNLFAATLAASLLSGCANSDLHSGDVYHADQAKRVQTVFYGTIVRARPVKIQGENKMASFGGIAGSVAGGLLGSGVGEGKGKELITVAGVIGGAIAGEQLADKVNQMKGIELEIEKERGGIIVVVQKMAPHFVVGKRVRVVSNGSKVNVSVAQ